ncbi:MAG: hypothetical protein GX567_06880 [Clostridia bacterium]|nr:hypothetical protein [Clostridia bacterium]
MPRDVSINNSALSLSSLPYRYGSKDSKYVTPTKNCPELRYRTVFSMMSMVETSLMKNGIADSIDGSELSMYYGFFRPDTDVFGNLTGDANIILNNSKVKPELLNLYQNLSNGTKLCLQSELPISKRNDTITDADVPSQIGLFEMIKVTFLLPE